MARRRVTFNIETATCGLCPQNEHEDDVEVGIGKAAAFCQTCGQFICINCLKTHRKLVVTENHQIRNRDHVITTEDRQEQSKNAVNGHSDAEYVARAMSILSSDAIKDYERYRAKLLEGLTKTPSTITNTGETTANNVDGDPEDLDEVGAEHIYNFTEPCNLHKDENIKYYCEFHKQLCCEVCKLRDHKLCLSMVKFIPETAPKHESMKTPFQKLETQISDFKEYDRKLGHDYKELKKSRDTFLYDFKEKKKEIMNWLNLMEVRAIRRLEIVFDKCKKDIEMKRRRAKQACDNLRAELYFLKEILRNQTNDDIYKFIKMKQSDACVEDAINTKEHRQFTNSRFGLKVNAGFETARHEAEQLYEIKFEMKGDTKYSIRLKEDKHVSNITGCTIMPTGDLAFADRNNAKVKVFNSQFKLTEKLTIPDGVFDITAISNKAVAVTSPLKSKINIVEIKPEPEIVKEIDTGHGSCWGVQHHEGLFVVNCSTRSSSFIRAIDLESSIIFQVETKCSFFCELSLKEDSKQLAISTAISYTDDRDGQAQHFIEEKQDDGNKDIVVMVYNYLNHLHTKGVAFDRHCNLVVCSKDTNQIYTISQNGNEVELMLAEADGLDAPQALCYTEDKRKLLVTSENTDFVQIFEFEQ